MDPYICHLTKQHLMDQKVALCILNTVGKELKANRFVTHNIVNVALLYMNYIKKLSFSQREKGPIK